MPIFGVKNLASTRYLGSGNNNIDKDSIFEVHTQVAKNGSAMLARLSNTYKCTNI